MQLKKNTANIENKIQCKLQLNVEPYKFGIRKIGIKITEKNIGWE